MKMLRILVVLFVVATIGACSKSSGDKETDKIPQAAKQSFKAQEAGVKGEKWEIEDGIYVVEFEKDGVEMEIGYDKDGNMMFIETEIEIGDLPVNVLEYIQEKYPEAETEGAEKIVKSVEVYYEVELELDETEIELLFDSDGNFFSEEIEKDNGDEGEEENEVEIDPMDLPEAVKIDISSRYSDSVLLEADEITHQAGEITYDVEIKTAEGEVIELMYKPDGTFLGIESDES
jgi:hypothetical protein